MTYYVRQSGAWVSKTSMQVKQSGSFVNKTTGYKRVGGAWVNFLAAPLDGYNTPSAITGEVQLSSTSHNVTGQGTGGTGSYSYAWTLVSNTGGYSLANASSQTCTVSRSGLVINVTYNCTARCTISDGVSSVVRDTPISITRTNPAGDPP